MHQWKWRVPRSVKRRSGNQMLEGSSGWSGWRSGRLVGDQRCPSRILSAAEAAGGDGNRSSEKKKEGDDATVKAAAAISESVTDHGLTAHEKRIAGPAVHYTFGSAMGALYGAASNAPASTKGFGLGFGSALWLAADGEMAAGLSKAPTEIPVSTHTSGPGDASLWSDRRRCAGSSARASEAGRQ